MRAFALIALTAAARAAVVQFQGAITGPGAGSLTAPALAAALNAAGSQAGYSFAVFSATSSSPTALSAFIAVSGDAVSTATVQLGFPQFVAGVSGGAQVGSVTSTVCDSASASAASCTLAAAYTGAAPAVPAGLPTFCGNSLPNASPATADIACWVGTETASTSSVSLVSTPGARFCGAFTDVATGSTRTYQTLTEAQMTSLTAQFSNQPSVIPYANIAVCSTASCLAPAADPCRVFRTAAAATNDFSTSSKIGLGVGITFGVIFFSVGLYGALNPIRPAAAPPALELKAAAV